MQKGKVYTHKRMIDCAIYIYNFKKNKDGYEVDVQWLTKSGLILDARGKELIKNQELNNWYEIHWRAK